jgi:AraC-like DNA-binding protein
VLTLQATVSMSWVRTVLAAAGREGVAEAVLLERAGIRPAELASERWPVDHITRLWRAAADLTQDPSFGLEAGAQVAPASLNVVAFILQSSATLRDAVAVVQKYQRLISDGGRLQLLAGASESWLVYHPCQGRLPFSEHQIEAVLAAVVSVVRWVTQRLPAPRLARFEHGRLGPLAGYRRAFGCPVEFGQAYNGLLLDNAVLDLPLPQADSHLAQLHDDYAAHRLHALSPQADLLDALRGWISANFGPPVPTRAMAADAFGVAERTLARRLGERGASFTGLLDDVRRAQALAQVGQTSRALSDIARDLGFADISPFYRAFRRWAGTSPAAWRGAAATGRTTQTAPRSADTPRTARHDEPGAC